MVDILKEMLSTLKYSKEQFNQEDRHILDKLLSKTIRDALFCGFLSYTIAWPVTRKLTFTRRLLVGGGAFLYPTYWGLNRSVESAIHHILQLEGTNLQMILTRIILEKYHDDSSRFEFVSKHFYPEKVFTDATLDKPLLWWRRKRFFGDSALQETYGNKIDDMPTKVSHKTYSQDSLGRLNKVEHEQLSQTSQIHEVHGMIVDPIGCVLGTVESAEEIQSAGGVSPRFKNKCSKKINSRRKAVDSLSG